MRARVGSEPYRSSAQLGAMLMHALKRPRGQAAPHDEHDDLESLLWACICKSVRKALTLTLSTKVGIELLQTNRHS